MQFFVFFCSESINLHNTVDFLKINLLYFEHAMQNIALTTNETDE